MECLGISLRINSLLEKTFVFSRFRKRIQGIVLGITAYDVQFESSHTWLVIARLLALLASILSQNSGQMMMCLIANHIGLASGVATVIHCQAPSGFTALLPMSKWWVVATYRYSEACMVGHPAASSGVSLLVGSGMARSPNREGQKDSKGLYLEGSWTQTIASNL